MAQQLLFPGWQQPKMLSGSCAVFENRYRYDPEVPRLQIGKTDLYRTLRVKKITVYDGKGDLNSIFEFDTSGNIIRNGYKAYYFTVSGTQQISGFERSTSMSYYQNEALVRTDTVFSKRISYRNADTLMTYTQEITKLYKVGHLINEQNHYYNTRYYRKHFKYSTRHEPHHTYYVRTKIGIRYRSRRGLILLKKKFKTNYDSSLLYFCGTKTYNENFVATSDSSRHYIQADKEISRHPFYLQSKNTGRPSMGFNGSKQNTYLIDGENFEEPCDYVVNEYCASHWGNLDRQMDALKEQRYYTSFEINNTAKGLYESYYQIYYPEDTSPEALEGMQKQRDEISKNQNLTLAEKDSYYRRIHYPRIKTPVKTLIYSMEYTFY